MSAATNYTASHDAAAAQQSRIFGPEPQGDPWGAMAGFFRLDPNREPEPNLRIISSYLRPEDVLVDVGGGAGRMCLPMARRCREVVMVEPSPGMGAEFDASRSGGRHRQRAAGCSPTGWTQWTYRGRRGVLRLRDLLREGHRPISWRNWLRRRAEG